MHSQQSWNAPWEQIKWFCYPNMGTHFTELASTCLWCENPAVCFAPKESANIFSLSIINQHVEIKIGCVKQYGLQQQGWQFDGQMKPKQHWSRPTSPETQRAENRNCWDKLGTSSAPRGIPCSCEQHFAVSLCLPGRPVWVIDSKPWAQVCNYKTGFHNFRKLTFYPLSPGKHQKSAGEVCLQIFNWP